MIIKEAIGVGSTVDVAREDAIQKLNTGLEEDIQFEIITFPKKKVLGLFGGSEAKVRAYVEGPDPAPKKEKTAKTESAKRNDRKPVRERAEKSVEKVEKAGIPVKSETVEKQELIGVPASEVDPNSQVGRAYKYLNEVLAKLGCENINATIAEIEGGSKIMLEGNDKLGVIIGRRGETLDALQYLASLVANEHSCGYYRVVINIGNYREKRESTLEALAKRTAGQVLRTGRSRSLEPMNPYERRVIHTAVQNIEGVESTSIGDGAHRRVVIIPEGKSVHLPDERKSNHDHKSGGRRSSRSTKPAATETTVSQKPKETDGTKLYGKLK